MDYGLRASWLPDLSTLTYSGSYASHPSFNDACLKRRKGSLAHFCPACVPRISALRQNGLDHAQPVFCS